MTPKQIGETMTFVVDGKDFTKLIVPRHTPLETYDSDQWKAKKSLSCPGRERRDREDYLFRPILISTFSIHGIKQSLYFELSS